MRHCVVVVASAREQALPVPAIRRRHDENARVMHWFAGRDQQSPDRLIDDERNALMRTLRTPFLMYRCYLFVGGVRTWSNCRPYVLIRGASWGARLCARAASWAGGNVIQAHDEPAGLLPQTRFVIAANGNLELND